MSSFGMDACMETFATLIIFHDVDELKQRLVKVWHDLGQSVTDTMDEWHKHLLACIHAKGGHLI